MQLSGARAPDRVSGWWESVGGRSAVGARQLCSPAGTGKMRNGGKTARAKKMSERVGDGSAGAAETAQEKRDRLWAKVKAEFDRRKEAERRVAPRLAAERNQRWEARWKAQEVREKAATYLWAMPGHRWVGDTTTTPSVGAVQHSPEAVCRFRLMHALGG